MKRKFLSIALLSFGFVGFASCDEKETPVYADPASTDEDFPFQGEYVGEHDGKTQGVQLLALGNGEFEVIAFQNGLPGQADDVKKVPKTFQAKRHAGAVTVESEADSGRFENGKLMVTPKSGGPDVVLSKIDRQSPTLGAKPPEGARVLFDGKAEGWKNGRVTEDGLLEAGAESEARLGDFQLHLEFRTPYRPEARGQGRGNSGVYLQGRYELQVLDSFGLNGEDNECGGIYKIARPKVNMCLPPLAWQTYDIDFTAAKFENGNKTANAKVTIKHNGVVIHENLELPNVTGGHILEESEEKGPITLQDHGNPVRFRNIWVVEKN